MKGLREPQELLPRIRAIHEAIRADVLAPAKPGAELRGAKTDRSGDEDLLRDLDAAGLVTVGSGRFRDFQPTRLRGKIRASAVVSEDRG